MKLFKDSVSREILLLHFTKKFIFYSFFCDTLCKKIFGGIAYESSQPASGHCRRAAGSMHRAECSGSDPQPESANL